MLDQLDGRLAVAWDSASHRLLPEFPVSSGPMRNKPRPFTCSQDRQDGLTGFDKIGFLVPYYGKIRFPVTVFRFTMLRRWRIAVSRYCLAT